MKTIKTALLAGVFSTVSTLAFAQAGAPTAGVDFGTIYGLNTHTDSNVSVARAGQHVRTRAVNHATIRQHETTGSGFTRGGGVGSPD